MENASEFLSLDNDVSNIDTEIFKAVNLIDEGFKPDRLERIKQKVEGDSKHPGQGEGFFERDLERILATNIWAYATHNAYEDRMPLLKAAYISLAIAGND